VCWEQRPSQQRQGCVASPTHALRTAGVCVGRVAQVQLRHYCHLCPACGRRRRGAASSLSGISRPDACRVFNPCAARGRSMRRAASCSSASSRPGGCRRTRRVSTSSSSSPASRTATRRRAPTPTLPRSLCLAGQGPAAARCGGRSPAVRGARVLLCLLWGSASAPPIRRDSSALWWRWRVCTLSSACLPRCCVSLGALHS